MHSEANLLRDFAIIMGVAGLGIVIVRRLGLPSILGYLIAGVLIGPFTFDNPIIEDLETIRRLADIGLVLLLFALGLEFGWERVRQVGLKVLFIGAVEITLMIALGYQLGIAMGWTGTESIFLGAAMSISSSAVLVKMLRDNGELSGNRGRLIVGILVVEDFAAVALLSILSGVATEGTASIQDVGQIAIKLAIFSGAALVGGALIAPRLVRMVAKLRSSDSLLVASLAMAFGLALVAEELGISAAAGAFLIGAVLGDTDYSEQITHRMEPVRDVFAALFFVSIGMLINVHEFLDFLVPAILVSVVFTFGKLFAITASTFVMGFDRRLSLRTGMGMPQTGEFSLAMVKVGADHGAVSGFLYPVVAVTTAITALTYPIFFGSADKVADFFDRRSPSWLKRYVELLDLWLTALQRAFKFNSPAAKQIQVAGRNSLIALALMSVLLGVGTFSLSFTTQLSVWTRLEPNIVGLVISGIVVALCIPSGFVLWRQISSMADLLSKSAYRPVGRIGFDWNTTRAEELIRDSLLAGVVILLGLWALPFIVRLLAIGELSVPIPILVLIALGLVFAKSVRSLHGVLQETLSQTMMGPAQVPTTAESTEKGKPDGSQTP